MSTYFSSKKEGTAKENDHLKVRTKADDTPENLRRLRETLLLFLPQPGTNGPSIEGAKLKTGVKISDNALTRKRRELLAIQVPGDVEATKRQRLKFIETVSNRQGVKPAMSAQLTIKSSVAATAAAGREPAAGAATHEAAEGSAPREARREPVGSPAKVAAKARVLMPLLPDVASSGLLLPQAGAPGAPGAAGAQLDRTFSGEAAAAIAALLHGESGGGDAERLAELQALLEQQLANGEARSGEVRSGAGEASCEASGGEASGGEASGGEASGEEASGEEASGVASGEARPALSAQEAFVANTLLVQLDAITSEGGVAAWLPSTVVAELERDDWRSEDFDTVECGLLRFASALERKGKAARRIARRVAIYTKAVGRADDWLHARA